MKGLVLPLPLYHISPRSQVKGQKPLELNSSEQSVCVELGSWEERSPRVSPLLISSVTLRESLLPYLQNGDG